MLYFMNNTLSWPWQTPRAHIVRLSHATTIWSRDSGKVWYYHWPLVPFNGKQRNKGSNTAPCWLYAVTTIVLFTAALHVVNQQMAGCKRVLDCWFTVECPVLSIVNKSSQNLHFKMNKTYRLISMKFGQFVLWRFIDILIYCYYWYIYWHKLE